MAADNFAACLAVTLVEEGGKVDNPADPGGRTNEGVTQRTYDAFRTRKGLMKRDVYLMTPAERDEIYKAQFWTPAGCDALPAGLDMMHFDGAVNSGVGRARAWLAKAQAKSATTKSATGDQVRAYASARLSFLEALRTWRTFGKGWARRVATVEAKALAMAAGTEPAAQAKVATIAAGHAAKATVSGVVARAASVVAVGSAAATALGTAHPAVPAAVGLAGLVAALAAGFQHWTSTLRATAQQG